MQTTRALQQIPTDRTDPDTVETDVPERLRELVTRTPEGLTLKSQTDRAARAPWVVGGLLTALFTGCGLLMAVGMLMAAFVSGEAMLMFLAAGMLGSTALTAIFILGVAYLGTTLFRAPVRIDHHSAMRAGRLGNTVTNPTHITLSGEVGSKIEIYLHGNGRMRLVKASPLNGEYWSLESLMWFAQATADQLGVPLNDELDHRKWSRWLTDGAFRQRLKFVRDHEANVRMHPKWHAVAPTTSHIKYQHHGASARHLTVTAKRASDGWRAIAPKQILAVSVHFDRINAPVPRILGTLRVLTATGSIGMAKQWIHGSADTSRLHGLAEMLRTYAHEAQQIESSGTRDDIPEALRVIRSDTARLDSNAQGPADRISTSPGAPEAPAEPLLPEEP